jgi:hypothetical protein
MLPCVSDIIKLIVNGMKNGIAGENRMYCFSFSFVFILSTSFVCCLGEEFGFFCECLSGGLLVCMGSD